VHLGVHEQPALEVDDGDGRTVGGRADREPSARGADAAEVRRPQDSVGRLEQRVEVAVTPDVVPGGDDVGPPVEQALRELRREARPVGRVLAVDDAEV
jgi:hypothetical protein